MKQVVRLFYSSLKFLFKQKLDIENTHMKLRISVLLQTQLSWGIWFRYVVRIILHKSSFQAVFGPKDRHTHPWLLFHMCRISKVYPGRDTLRSISRYKSMLHVLCLSQGLGIEDKTDLLGQVGPKSKKVAKLSMFSSFSLFYCHKSYFSLRGGINR